MHSNLGKLDQLLGITKEVRPPANPTNHDCGTATHLPLHLEEDDSTFEFLQKQYEVTFSAY